MRNNKGFTMMELMISCAILVFCLVGALQTYLNISDIFIQSKNKVIAATHAKSILEEIRSWENITVKKIVNQDWLDWISDLNNLQETELLPKEDISIKTQSPLLVSVTISWNEKNGLRSITLKGGFS